MLRKPLGQGPKEFSNSMNIAKREARETLFWLRVLKETALVRAEKVDPLLTEANELVSILTTIVKRAEMNSAFAIQHSTFNPHGN